MPVSMDRYPGHLIFGGVLAGTGVWWAVLILQRHYEQLSKKKPFYATTWYRTKFCAHLPLEPVIRLFIGLCTGFMMWYDFIRSIKLDDGMAVTAGPHAVAMAMYIWLPVVEILEFYQCTAVGMFENITFVTQILGVLSGLIVFSFHGHGRLIVDAHIHHLVAICFMLLLITVITEYKYRNSVVVSLTKSYLYILIGLWTICAAFMLASHVDAIPPWDLAKSDNIVLATCLFIFIMTVILVFMFTMVCLVGRRYKHFFCDTHAKCDGFSTNAVANGITCKNI